LFTLEQVAALPLVGEAFAAVDRDWPGLDGVRRRHEALRRVFGAMVEDVIAESRRRLAELDPASATAVRRAGRGVVGFSGAMEAQLKEIRAFFFTHMYRHWKVRRMRRKAGQIIREMFAIFMEDPGMLPEDWQHWAAKGGDSQKAWVIADYIAGMTDRYALQEFGKLTNPMEKA
jgi:dGTPase